MDARMKGLHLVLRWRLWDTEIKTDFTTTFTWVKSIITGEKKSVSKTKHRNARQAASEDYIFDCGISNQATLKT